ncbi:DUF3054 domain-containing protein [Tessaracoccus antarcticus]|uniref:DUF3054 domain-containing protein n=1 Tax=Tessaracoccus antarcticus TaxID=2479848 RepID=A0A3M0G184_9ACTN|nr:DUF3054 domain-containing protein [Tessaracoccus antarcticus]RMB58721.1 DUF3054 domain-containing protein [Tessaracoccus antarcticus]
MVRILPAVIDLVFVVIFAVVGRASHAERLSIPGVAQTAWPFLAACLFAWVVVGLLDDSGYGPRAALVIWLVTVLAGMGLRIVAGDTAETAFVIVATLVLFSSFFGWRLVVRLIRARKQTDATVS